MRNLRFVGALTVALWAGAAAAQEAELIVPETVTPGSSTPITDEAAPVAGGAVAAEPALIPFVPPMPLPTLNYNYWYPGQASGYMPARMYLCPRPVPVRVGYTYITYQALNPHEFLWCHARGYIRYHADGSSTTTTVTWR
jgi:hypothetical protein